MVKEKPRAKSRRTFLRALAVAPIVPALEAQDSPPPQASRVDALANDIQLRFGPYLADGDMPEIKRGIERMLRNADAINRIKITNADEPDFLFHPQDL